ncbi:hypothetical protein AOLI_G00310330 [Acnodon oligacanthus]
MQMQKQPVPRDATATCPPKSAGEKTGTAGGHGYGHGHGHGHGHMTTALTHARKSAQVCAHRKRSEPTFSEEARVEQEEQRAAQRRSSQSPGDPEELHAGAQAAQRRRCPVRLLPIQAAIRREGKQAQTVRALQKESHPSAHPGSTRSVARPLERNGTCSTRSISFPSAQLHSLAVPPSLRPSAVHHTLQTLNTHAGFRPPRRALLPGASRSFK